MKKWMLMMAKETWSDFNHHYLSRGSSHSIRRGYLRKSLRESKRGKVRKIERKSKKDREEK